VKYLEDFVPGEVETVGDHSISPDEIIEYGKAWDPQPIHIGSESAAAAEFGGLVAAGTHLVAITVLKLVTHLPKVAIIAGLGWDQVRFHRPARPGDKLTVTRECLDVRPSKSKNDRGVVRNRITLTNQAGELVLSYIDAILVARRPADHQNAGG